MDRDVRNVLIVCLASLALTTALFALRVRPAPAASVAPAPAASVRATPARAASPKVAGDVPLTQFAIQQWSGAIAGEETAGESDAPDEEEPEPPRTFKRWRKGKKQAKAGWKDIEAQLQDPDDEPDDGRGDEEDEGEEIRSPRALAAVMAAEDAQGGDDEDEDEDGSELLGEDEE